MQCTSVFHGKKNQINSLQLHFILIHTGIYDYGGGYVDLINLNDKLGLWFKEKLNLDYIQYK